MYQKSWSQSKQTEWQIFKAYCRADNAQWSERVLWALLGATLFITLERVYYYHLFFWI